MTDSNILPDSPSLASNLLEHIVFFARLLRIAGLRVATGSVIEAVAAVEKLDIRNPDDLETCLFAFFVQRQEFRRLFQRVFTLYWRQAGVLAALEAGSADMQQQDLTRSEELADRLSESLAEEDRGSETEFQFEVDRSQTASAIERLRSKDFEAMSAEELMAAEKMLSRLQLPLNTISSRRFRAGIQGNRLDMRASLRAALRADGAIPLRYKKRRHRQPPIVILCDVSGSMSLYSRMFLHFMHAVSNDRDRVYSFVFGTRLTNISRQLLFRDVDRALAAAAQAVEDWSGGTRIEESLRCFNRLWSRRVLSQGAIVLLITDGLDRGEGSGLEKEMERLAKSSRRLIWLNPLLRYEGFQPRAAGIKTMLPYVDDFRSAHNIDSLVRLAEILAPNGADSGNNFLAFTRPGVLHGGR